MPAQEVEVRRALAVRAKSPYADKLKIAPTSWIGPFVPAQFSVIGLHRKSGTWRYINDFIVSMTWEDSTEEAALQATLQLNNLETDNGRIGDWMSVGAPVKLMFSMEGHTNPQSAKWHEIARFNVWNLRRINSGTDGPSLEMILYDQMQYLKSSYDTFLYYSGNKPKKVAWNAYQITRDICRRFKIPIGHIPKFKNMEPIPYIYKENISIYDFLLTIWTIERDASKQKRKFVIRFVKGKLYITVKSARNRIWELRGASSDAGNYGGLTDASYEYGIDPGDHKSGTATSVTVRGVKVNAEGENQRVAMVSRTVTNNKLMQSIGRLHKVIEIQGLGSKAVADKKGRRYLDRHKTLKQQGSVSAIGIPFLRAGDAVYVEDPESRIKGKFYCTTVSQSLDSAGNYSMQVGINLNDSVPRLDVDPEELKPIDSGSAESDGATKPAKMPKDVFDMLVKALNATGLPVAWAASNAMAELLHHESGYQWFVQNKQGSGAYGLFQFMPETWGAVASNPKAGPLIRKVFPTGPYNQRDKFTIAVFGVCYIYMKYGNPEQAWNFWNARVPINGRDVGNWY